MLLWFVIVYEYILQGFLSGQITACTPKNFPYASVSDVCHMWFTWFHFLHSGAQGLVARHGSLLVETG